MPDNLSKISLFTRTGSVESSLVKSRSITLTGGAAPLNIGKDVAGVVTGITIPAGSLVLGVEITTSVAVDVAGAKINGMNVGAVAVFASNHDATSLGAVTTFAVMRTFSADSAVTIDVDTNAANWSTATVGSLNIKVYTAAPTA